MRKLVLVAIIFILLFISAWIHEPWIYLFSLTTNGNLHIPEVLNLILSALIGAVIAFLLVLAVEWLKGSRVEIDKIEPVFPPGDRKLLKIGVKIKRRWLGKLLKLPSNVHSFATLTIYINHDPKSSYRAKWDNAPEPWEYQNPIYQELAFSGSYINKKKIIPLELNGVLSGKARGYPRMNLLPQAMQTENLVPDDQATTSVLAKTEGESHFYIFDPEYYIDLLRESSNKCDYKKIYLRIRFKSSLGSHEDYFRVLNPNSHLARFNIEKISKEEYESYIKLNSNS